MPAIVISYRRADSRLIVGRVFDRLEHHFGRETVFVDVDRIPPGVDFREHLRHTLSRCDVLLAIIGPKWMGGESGSRLDDPQDWVRMEIEMALARKIPIIPILLDQTPMPSPEALPESLRDLAFRHAARLDTDIDFRVHMDRVIRAIETCTAKTEPSAAASEHVIADPIPDPDIHFQRFLTVAALAISGVLSLIYVDFYVAEVEVTTLGMAALAPALAFAASLTQRRLLRWLALLGPIIACEFLPTDFIRFGLGIALWVCCLLFVAEAQGRLHSLVNGSRVATIVSTLVVAVGCFCSVAIYLTDVFSYQWSADSGVVLFAGLLVMIGAVKLRPMLLILIGLAFLGTALSELAYAEFSLDSLEIKLRWPNAEILIAAAVAAICAFAIRNQNLFVTRPITQFILLFVVTCLAVPGHNLTQYVLSAPLNHATDLVGAALAQDLQEVVITKVWSPGGVEALAFLILLLMTRRSQTVRLTLSAIGAALLADVVPGVIAGSTSIDLGAWAAMGIAVGLARAWRGALNGEAIRGKWWAEGTAKQA